MRAVTCLLACTILLTMNPPGASAQTTEKGKRTAKARDSGKRATPKESSTPAARIKAPKGFRVELLYSVPRETQGSWVNMAVDPKGRLIVSDQYGKLYRVTPPPAGGKADAIKVEPIDVAIGEAHGLLWAFDSLYVVVNRGRRYDQRAVPRPRHRWRRPARHGRAPAQAQRRGRARAARGDPGARRPVALRRGRQRHEADRALRLARAPRSGARTTFCRGWSTAAAS